MQAEREAQKNMARLSPGDASWVRFVFADRARIAKAKAVVGLAKGVLASEPSGALQPQSGPSPVGEVRMETV